MEKYKDINLFKRDLHPLFLIMGELQLNQKRYPISLQILFDVASEILSSIKPLKMIFIILSPQ